MKRNIYLLLSMLFIHASCFAQTTITIQGKIIDELTQECLPFTNIIVVGLNKGTVSNAQGVYKLDLESVALHDSVQFSFIGYERCRKSVKELQKNGLVALKPSIINLQAVEVRSKELTAKDIVEEVAERYKDNHPVIDSKRRVFFHKYEKVPFNTPENKIEVKHSDFVGLEDDALEDIYKMLPDEFIEYQDGILDQFNYGGEQKVELVNGVALEEGSQQDLFKQLEAKMGAFMTDIERTSKEEGVYYKLKSGILGTKLDDADLTDDSGGHPQDSLHNYINTDYLKGEVWGIWKNYAMLEGKNWDFINSTNKYKYVIDEITSLDNEVVYKISFKPRSGGLFQGTMFVSAHDFGVLQLDFAYAPNKKSENFQILGIGHAMRYKEGRVIFEKRADGYFVKYIYAKEHETALIDRSFSLQKKKERFLFDKELNEIKIDTELHFNIHRDWEILVINEEPLAEADYNNLVEQKELMFKKQYVYSKDMWSDMTVIAPASELRKYK